MIFRTKHFLLLTVYFAISGIVFSVLGIKQISSQELQNQTAQVSLAIPKEAYTVIQSTTNATEEERAAFTERVRKAYEQSMPSTAVSDTQDTALMHTQSTSEESVQVPSEFNAEVPVPPLDTNVGSATPQQVEEEILVPL